MMMYVFYPTPAPLTICLYNFILSNFLCKFLLSFYFFFPSIYVVQSKDPPIVGPYADDARELISLRYLYRFTPGQDCEKEEQLARWNRLHELLGLDDSTGLRALQEYIAVTPPDERCPCRHGVRLLIADDHFPGCRHATLHQQKLRYRQRRAAIQERRGARNRDEKRSAEILTANWKRGSLKQLPRTQLLKMKRQLTALLH